MKWALALANAFTDVAFWPKQLSTVGACVSRHNPIEHEAQVGHCANKLGSMKVRAWVAVICLGTLWSISAAWLAANQIIPVFTEATSYWLACPAVLFAMSRYLAHMRNGGAPREITNRDLLAGLAVFVAFAFWWGSDRAFVFWKLRAIPAAAWPEMVSDLEKVGRRSLEGDGYHAFNGKEIPKSLHQLGAGFDYKGGNAQRSEFPEYSGVIASVWFGYRPRTWGLYVGPEAGCPLHMRYRVGPNAFFFFGPHG